MIEQLAKFLAKVILNKDAGDQEEVMSDIQSAFGTILGVDAALFDVLSAQDIAELLGISKDKATGSIKCIIAARLLKEKADIQEHSDKDSLIASSYYRKALSLYLDGILNCGYTELDMTGYYADVKEIADKLSDSLPEEILLKMFRFHVLLEEYDKAENYLFRLKEAHFPAIRNVGMEFYKMLENMEEGKLKAVKMTREDVIERLNELLDDKLNG